ncbi:succinyl-diaminopimelate desuccinylase [Lysobacteraceae bacterium NML71-0210]|nr:succinyl-diaminopimelate desuccinylase [Xanthomonadaceae bacterium NML71-0210]
MNDVVALACALISRPSITPEDAGCQALIAERLARCGFDIEHLRFNNVDNLWASHGSGDPVLLLLGHTDVVPPGNLDAWQSAPFTPEIRDGLLYGRGAADMKGSVAAFVVALEQFVTAHPEHPGTIALLLTSDEEGAALHGVRQVAEVLRARAQRIDWCITGEPSSKQRLGDLLRVGRRGSLSARLIIQGVQGHVAYPELARNPIHATLPALAELAGKQWDRGFDSFPPTSLQITDTHAGNHANNVIPGQMEVLFNLRYNPNWNAAALQAACEAIFKHHQLDYQIHWHHSGAPFHTPEGVLRQTARQVLTEFSGTAPEESTGGGTSDARFIAPLGAECIEIGPVNASIHQVDEHIRLTDLEALPALYLRLIERLLLALPATPDRG